jgi:hypothetical protein
MRSRDYFRSSPQDLLAFFRTPALATRVQELGGYNISSAGMIRHAP